MPNENEDEEMKYIMETYMKEHLSDMKAWIDGNTNRGRKYPTDDLIPVLLKLTYNSQETLKKSQDELNNLTNTLITWTKVLVILTIVLAIIAVGPLILSLINRLLL